MHNGFILSLLPAKEMVCDFKRIYIWHFCGRKMSITYVSLPVAINQCRPSDLHWFKKENVQKMSAFVLHSIFLCPPVFLWRDITVLSSQHSAALTSLWPQFGHFTTIFQTMRSILNKQNTIAVTGIQLQNLGLTFCWQWALKIFFEIFLSGQ